jgi:hypothetical protein
MGERTGFILQTVGIFWIIIIVLTHIFVTGAVDKFLVEDNFLQQLAVIVIDIIFNIPGIILIIVGRSQLKKSKITST